MSSLLFDFNNAMAQRVGHGFEITKSDEEMRGRAHSAMKAKKMGFRSLPTGQESILDDIIATANDIAERFDNFVVLGIGGSALGPIAVHQALDTGQSGINFVVEDNVDPERLKRTFDSLDLTKTMFNVVTKSGKTSETMAQMMVVAGMLKKAGLSLVEIKKRLGKGIDDLLIGGLDDSLIGRFDDLVKGRDRGQMSEVRSQGSVDGRTDGIDLLAVRVAEVVKSEVHKFFEGEGEEE